MWVYIYISTYQSDSRCVHLEYLYTSDIGVNLHTVRVRHRLTYTCNKNKKSDNRVQSQIVWRPTRSYISWVIKWRGYLVVVAKTSYWYIENLIILIIRNSRILPMCLKEGFYNVDLKVLTSYYLYALCVLYYNKFGFISLIKNCYCLIRCQ